jgi:hypothetical protein
MQMTALTGTAWIALALILVKALVVGLVRC